MKNKIIPSLTGLRFVAAFLVCTSHITLSILPQTSAWQVFLSRLSAEGMSLFFVLSGFVIHYNYFAAIQVNPKVGLYRFFTARFSRLVPLFLFCLLIDVILTWRHSPTHHIPYLLEVLPYYLSLTQSWCYSIVGQHSLIYQFDKISQVSWSISTEWFFYFCYPLIGTLIFNAKKMQTKIITLINFSILTIVFIALCHYQLPIINQFAIQTFGPFADYYQFNQDSFYRWLLYFSPYMRISEFIVGCLVAAIYLETQSTSNASQSNGMFFTMLALLAVVISHGLIWNPITFHLSLWVNDLHRCFGFAPAFALLIFCCARYTNSITTLLTHRLLLIGGEVSYSIYLWHTLIIDFINFHFTNLMTQSPALFKFIIIFSVVILFSLLSYKLIEAPARDVLRKLLQRKASIKSINSAG